MNIILCYRIVDDEKVREFGLYYDFIVVLDLLAFAIYFYWIWGWKDSKSTSCDGIICGIIVMLCLQLNYCILLTYIFFLKRENFKCILLT